jgi:membrane protease subunit (stomatin/prohibitin family)
MYSTSEIEDYLNRVIVSRFNDFMGEKIDSIMNLPAKYDELSKELVERLRKDFQLFGLSLAQLYINSITPPPEVQQAIDDRSRMGVFQDMDKLMRMKAAMAMEKASEADGSAGAGMGIGVGMMLPAMFSQFVSESTKNASGAACQECQNVISKEAKFCPHCGHQQVVFAQCVKCGKNLTPNAKFCPRCGSPAEEKPNSKICRRCKTENLSDSSYCNQCGEKLDK